MFKQELAKEINQVSSPIYHQAIGERPTARMRTLVQAISEIRAIDPQSAFTLSALRAKTRSGEIPSTRVGKKYLVNLDILISYLNNPASFKEMSSPIEINKIRKVV